jgi:CTP synthase
MAMQPRYIFITGGVVSSLGKGITASAIGFLLEQKGLRVALMKLDPYLNVDPGTMSPYQHGEVYVTPDGAETDLDLGHYFRFTHSPLSRKSSVSAGQIYHEVIKRERRGDYLGKTVQVIPHITDEIKRRIIECGDEQAAIDVVIVEIGGTVGDIESLPFLEAIRQMRNEKPKSCLNIHVTYVPFIKAAGEVKTKPTQHSVQLLRQIGISCDILVCRSESKLSDDVKEKLSLFCNVPQEAVIEAADVETSIYEVPLYLHEQKIENKIAHLLDLPLTSGTLPHALQALERIIHTVKHPKGTVRIGLVGKYVQHQDAYKSVIESLHHGAIAAGYKLEIVKIESDKFDDKIHFPEWAQECDGYLVPGGFGERGWEGKLLTAKYCRERHIPYFGICLGMQVLVVEFARNILGLQKANSTEMDISTPHPVISLLEEQHIVTDRGGTMRLGAYPCNIKSDSLAHKAYNSHLIHECHRHRYEMNNKYREQLDEAGLLVSGTYEQNNLAEIVEVTGHPWMIGVQFHPEFSSKPLEPHPLFCNFIKACIELKLQTGQHR